MTPRPAAAATLAVPPDADPAAARAAFLRHVAAAGYVPPEDACAAANALAETALPLSLSARADAAVAVREAIDEFAREYWQTPPPARGLARAALAAAGPPPADARFLVHLFRAENLDAELPPDPAARDLAGVLCELYRSRPRQRAVRRAAWLKTRDVATDWAAAANTLEVAAPAVARLDRPLADRLTGREVPAIAPLPRTALPQARVVSAAVPRRPRRPVVVYPPARPPRGLRFLSVPLCMPSCGVQVAVVGLVLAGLFCATSWRLESNYQRDKSKERLQAKPFPPPHRPPAPRR